MKYKRLNNGMLGSNCYIIGDNEEGIIIDPGAETDEIMDALKETGLKIKYIVLTHAHIDHILNMDTIREKTGAAVAVHSLDADALGDARQNGALLFGLDKIFGNADLKLEHGQVLTAGGLSFEIIHTPGHTPGCICIKADDRIFTGDTLFRMSVGRTDLGRGSQEDLMDSLLNRLMILDDELVVYPGHGTTTTIGYEKKFNPFI